MPQELDANQQRELLEAQAAAAGVTKEDVRRAGWDMHDMADPFGPNPWANEEDVQWNDYEQPFMKDLASGVYNEFVLGLGEGLANLLPVAAQATGAESELFDDWIKNTSEWFDKQKTIYSDSAYKPVKDFGDYFSSGKLGSTIGEGIGFVMAIAGSRGLGGTSKIGKFANLSNRAKSFGVGTAMMYNDIYHEAKNAGFSSKDAARISLGTAGVVSLTEGAALEWIGKGATSFLPKEIATQAFSKTLKEAGELGVKDFWKRQKLFSKNLLSEIGLGQGAKAMRNKAGDLLLAGTRGAAIEAGQEFSQTYIEDGLKEMYDRFITGTDLFTKEMFTKDQFQEAVFSGIIGGIIGGGMGMASGINNNVDTALGYIDRKVKKGDYKSLDKMYAQIDDQLKNGQITEQEHANVTSKLKDLQEYSEQTKRLNINDPVVNHQLYELLKTQKDAQNIIDSELNTDGVPELVAVAYNKNRNRAEQVTQKLNQEVKHLIENKDRLTSSKEKFNKMNNMAQKLYVDVVNDSLNDEQFQKRLDEIGIKSKTKTKEDGVRKGLGEEQEFKGDEKTQQVEKDDQAGEQFKEEEKKTVLEDFEPISPSEQQKVEKDDEVYYESGGEIKPGIVKDQSDDTVSVESEKGDILKLKKSEIYKPKKVSPPPSAKKEKVDPEPVKETIADKDYELFTDTGIVNKKVIDDIASKIKKGERLSEREKAISKDQSSRIEKVLEEDAIQEREAKKVDAQEQAEPSPKVGEQVPQQTEQQQEVESKAQEELKPIDERFEKTPEYQPEITYAGQNYSVSPEGEIKNIKSGHKVRPDTALGKQVIQRAGLKEKVQEKAPDAKTSITNDYQNKSASSKVPNNLDFGSTDLDIDSALPSVRRDRRIKELNEEGLGNRMKKIQKHPKTRKMRADKVIDELIEANKKKKYPSKLSLLKSRLLGRKIAEQDAATPIKDRKSFKEINQFVDILEAIKPYVQYVNIYVFDDFNFSDYDSYFPIVQGAADYHGNIYLNANRFGFGYTLDTLTHELMHNMTMHILNGDQEADIEFRNKVEELLDIAREKLADYKDYGLTNVHEFVSEAFSNPGFQARLSTIKSGKNYKSNIFKDFVNAIRNFIKKSFGLEVKNSVLEDIINLVGKKIEDTYSTQERTETPDSSKNDADVLPSLNHPAGILGSHYDSNISENPDLFIKIQKHFKKLFPKVTVNTMENMVDKYGNEILGQVVNNAVTLDRNNALQSTQVHEFAEIYLDILKDMNPYLYSRGLDFVEGTKYHEEAKITYKDYSPDIQLREALVQAVTESSLDKLTEKFEGGPIDKFLAWMKNLWNKIKNQLKNNKKKDIVEIISNDLALRRTPVTTAVPNVSLRYQLGDRTVLRDKGMPFTSNVVNTAILMAKFEAGLKEQEPSAAAASLITFKGLFERYISELKGDSIGPSIYAGRVDLGVTLETLDDLTYQENLNNFFNMFKYSYPERWKYIVNAIENSLSDVAPETIDHSKIEIKPKAGVSANTRAIISNIIDYETGTPISKENVLRTILSANNNSRNADDFMDQLKKKSAKGDLVANRLNFILKALGDAYSKPIIRDLTSLEQVKYTSVVVNADAEGNVNIRKRIVNYDHNQEEQIDRFSNQLLQSVRNGKLEKHASKIRKYRYMSESSKIEIIEQAYKDIFGLDQFNFHTYSKITGKGVGQLIKFLYDANSKLGVQSTKKDVLSRFKNYLKQLSIAETELDVLQPNFVNTLGNRVTSVRLESNFSQVRKNLNDNRYVVRLKTQALYNRNPIVRALISGMNMEMSIHDAISNVVSGVKDEYSNQSTIDNKVNGLVRFALAQATNSKHYDQWIGVTADRGYQTFFTAPNFNIVDSNGNLTMDGKKLMNDMYSRDLHLVNSLESDWSKLDDKSLSKFVKALNDLSINNYSIEDGKIKVEQNSDPSADPKYGKDIDFLISEIDSLGLKDIITENTGMDIQELVSAYFWNDYVNRKSLEDLYTGPLERHLIKSKLNKKTVKDISEPIKRMGLANSVGIRNEIDKPVRVVYLDTSGVSDSFSFNGSYFQNRLKDLGGDLDKVGSSVKDSFFQVDHFNDGRTMSMKMSTLGLERKLDAEGNYTGNNFNDFTPAGNNNEVTTSNIGDAIIAYENWIPEDAPYIKVVDTDVTKNEIPDGAEVMHVKDFLNYVNTNQFEEIEKRSPAIEFTNYRTVFNLHKDLSKVPLSEQSVRLGTQFTVIASNNDTKEEIEEVDRLITNLLKKELGNVPSQLSDVDSMVMASLMHADETQSTFTQRVLKTIMDHNMKSNLYEGLSKVLENNKGLESQINAIDSGWAYVKEGHPMFDLLNDVKEDLFSGRSLDEIVEGLSVYKSPINTFDHPNIKFLMENTISSKLTKNGINLKIPGNYLRVVPDFNEDLEFHNPETGKVSDIAVPWSMFGNTREQAENLLKKANETGEGLKTIAVRIPTSGNTMIFAAKVKYFIDGNSNNVSVPSQFIEVSDSDHDADKLFVYRQEISNEGNVVPGELSDLFDNFFKRVSDPRFIDRTLNESVEVSKMRERVENILDKIEGVEESVETSLRTLQGVSEVANAMKDGLDGVGIFAVAVKTLSVMYQSGVKIKKPITIDYGTESITIDEISIDSLEDAALYLQAALDNAKEMVLGFSGVNKDNMGNVSAMLIAGLNVEQITSILNDPNVKNYDAIINSNSSLFSMKERLNKSAIKEKFKRRKSNKRLFRETTPLTGAQRVLVERLTKADKMNQPITTDLSPGIYRSTVSPDRKTRFYHITVSNNQKQVSLITPDVANSLLVQEFGSEKDVLDSYFEVEKLSAELSSITPLVQLDAGLKNNGFDNKTLEDKLNVLKKNELTYFNVAPLVDRIRYQHYMNVNNLQRHLEQKHFLTEQAPVYSANENVFKSLRPDTRNKKSTKIVLDETIQTMYAQKMLSTDVKNMNREQMDVWFNNFVNKVNVVKIISLGVSSSIKPGLKNVILTKVNQGVNLNLTEKAIYEKIREEEEMFNEFSGTIELDNGSSVLLTDFIKDNVFLQYLEVVEVDGIKKVGMKKVFRGLSQDEMKAVSLSYNEIVKIMPTFAAEILDYQLLTNGLNDKIGSYAMMFPDNIHVKYLEVLSKKTGFREGVSDVQQTAFEINTALRLLNELKKVDAGADSKYLTSKYYNVDGKLHVVEQDELGGKTLVDAGKYGSFITNGTYYKFGDIKEYAKLSYDKESVSKEELDELKKCLRGNG